MSTWASRSGFARVTILSYMNSYLRMDVFFQMGLLFWIVAIQMVFYRVDSQTDERSTLTHVSTLYTPCK